MLAFGVPFNKKICMNTCVQLSLCNYAIMQLCNCLYAIVSMQLCNCVKMEGAYYCAESVIDMNKNAEIQLYTSVILVVSYQQVLSENC